MATLLNEHINANSSICQNEKKDHNVKQLLLNSAGAVDNNNFLASLTDPQLIIQLPFSGLVNIKSIQIFANNDDSCPKTVKLFINRPNLSFADAPQISATQDLECEPEECGKDDPKPFDLKMVKFRNVKELALFVEDNHGAASTIIKAIKIFGTALETTEMKNLKKSNQFADSE